MSPSYTLESKFFGVTQTMVGMYSAIKPHSYQMIYSSLDIALFSRSLDLEYRDDLTFVHLVHQFGPARVHRR